MDGRAAVAGSGTRIRKKDEKWFARYQLLFLYYTQRYSVFLLYGIPTELIRACFFFLGRLRSDGTHIEEVETTKQRDEDEKETTNQRNVSIFAVGKHSCSVTFVLC